MGQEPAHNYRVVSHLYPTHNFSDSKFSTDALMNHKNGKSSKLDPFEIDNAC